MYPYPIVLIHHALCAIELILLHKSVRMMSVGASVGEIVKVDIIVMIVVIVLAMACTSAYSMMGEQQSEMLPLI